MRSIILISLCLCLQVLSAQSKEEILEMLPSKQASSSYFLSEVNNVSLLKSMLHFYKNFISSQDASNCSFSPSCSEYAAIAIKKQGLIKGLINFADRFQRCHGKDPDQYIYLKEKHLLYDPVRDGKYHLIE